MSHRSPFHLLDFGGMDPNDSMDQAIRKAKRRLMAEFEIAGTTTIEVNGEEYDRSQVVAALDALQQDEHLEFHRKIHLDTELREFLENGALPSSGFSDPSRYEKDRPFLDFVSPLVVERYESLFDERIKAQAFDEVLELMALSFPANRPGREQMARKLGQYLDRRLRRLKEIIEKLKTGPAWKGEILTYFDEAWLDFVNELPDRLAFRNELALAMCAAALAYQKKGFAARGLARKARKTALEIETDTQTRKSIQNRLDLPRQPHAREEKKKAGERPNQTRKFLGIVGGLLLMIYMAVTFLFGDSPSLSGESADERKPRPIVTVDPEPEFASEPGIQIGGYFFGQLSQALEVHSRFVAFADTNDERLNYFNQWWGASMRPETGAQPYQDYLDDQPDFEGRGEVKVSNRTKDDAIVFLYSQNAVLDHRYIRSGDALSLRPVGGDFVGVAVYVGSKFYPKAEPDYYTLPGYSAGDTTAFEINADQKFSFAGAFVEPIKAPSFAGAGLHTAFIPERKTSYGVGWQIWEYTISGERGHQKITLKKK